MVLCTCKFKSTFSQLYFDYFLKNRYCYSFWDLLTDLTYEIKFGDLQLVEMTSVVVPAAADGGSCR